MIKLNYNNKKGEQMNNLNIENLIDPLFITKLPALAEKIKNKPQDIWLYIKLAKNPVTGQIHIPMAKNHKVMLRQHLKELDAVIENHKEHCDYLDYSLRVIRVKEGIKKISQIKCENDRYELASELWQLIAVLSINTFRLNLDYIDSGVIPFTSNEVTHLRRTSEEVCNNGVLRAMEMVQICEIGQTLH
jgi:hypothetical protein